MFGRYASVLRVSRLLKLRGRKPLLAWPPFAVLVQHRTNDAPLPAFWRLPPLEEERWHSTVLVSGHPAMA